MHAPRHRIIVFALVLATLLIILPPTLISAEGQSGTTLTATVDATPHWIRTYPWTITKGVSPGTLNLFLGDSGTANYTVTVDRGDPSDNAYVDGQACVTNGGAVATVNLQINIVLRGADSQNADIINTALVDLSSNPVLDPGEGACYAYQIGIPASVLTEGHPLRIDADVTITNHSGHLDVPFGPSPAATTAVPAPTLVNASINVTDTNGLAWSTGDDASWTYSQTFTCGVSGIHGNVATIVETGQSAPAEVTVNCYSLTVTKDAATSFNRYYNWTVAKSADQSALTLSPGQSFLVNYEVTVGTTYTDADFAVTGSIWVHNPAPIAATLTGVADVVSPATAATVNCGVAFPYSLGAGGTLMCSYNAALPDASSQTNTATATLQNTPSGTTTFSGTAGVVFGSQPNNEIDECVSVNDSILGALGGLCQGGATIQYSMNVGPYATCGLYEFVNTASVTTNDTGTVNDSAWTVDVNVPCAGGCSLTPGYWKTHSEMGPAPYDDTWALLPGGASTAFFNSGQSYYQVLWTQPQGGNAYYILAHAYIAAYLNGLNGADTSAVEDELEEAYFLFLNNTTNDVPRSERRHWIELATTLDNYNNGYIGPGHCSE